MQFYLNNIMNHSLYIAEDFEIPSLNTSIETREVAGRDGFILGNKRVDGYNFVIPFHYINHKDKPYQDIINELTTFFNRDKEVRLRFEGEYWYWNAIFTGTIEFKQKTQGFTSFELNCIITDPYKYSNERFNTVSENDHLTLLNNGTAHTYPIFKATALKDSTMLTIAKNDEDYFMIGEPEDVFKQNKKTNPTIYNTNFNATTGWTSNTNEDKVSDAYAGGTVGGTTRIENGTVRIASLPNNKTGWLGANMKRSITESMQDFDITMSCRLYSDGSQKQTSKAMTHLYDENNNLVAALGLLDASYERNATLFVAVFDAYGARKTIVNHTHPMFNVETFTHIRLSRIGNEFQVKAWRQIDWDSYDKNEVYTKRFIDAGDLYKTPVRQVGFYLGRHSRSTDIETNPSISHITISRPAESKENEIPYVVETGDVIEINTQKEVVLVNGEPKTSLKDFGSHYFNVEAGLTEILIEPQKTFNVEAEWRDRFY